MQGNYRDEIISLVKRKEFSAAYDLVYNTLSIYPTNLFLLKNEIYILYRLKKIKEARQRAEERFPILKNDLFFLKTYLSILEKEKAKEDIENLIEKSILYERIKNEGLYIFLSGITERVFGKEKAIEILKRALLIMPESKELKVLLDKKSKDGVAESRYNYYKDKFKGKKTAETIREIESIRLLPDYKNDNDLYVYLAELYKKTGEYDNAIDIYKKLLSLKDSLFARKMLGYAYYKKKDYVNALLYLMDIFKENPHDHYLYSTIFNIYKKKKDAEGFNMLIKETLSIHPDAKHLYGLIKRADKWAV